MRTSVEYELPRSRERTLTLRVKEVSQFARRFLALILILTPLLVASCGGASGSPTSPSAVAITVTGTGVTTYTYSANVRPILTADCTGCHNSSQHEGGYDFTTYAGVLRALTPGSEGSLLVHVI